MITTDSSGQMWNACVWDPHSGTSLLTYKGNSTGSGALCVLGRDYLLGAVCNKPLLQVWPLQKKVSTAVFTNPVTVAVLTDKFGAIVRARKYST